MCGKYGRERDGGVLDNIWGVYLGKGGRGWAKGHSIFKYLLINWRKSGECGKGER